MARSVLSLFQGVDRNSAAIFASVNANLQRGFAAQRASTNQAITLSQTVRKMTRQDQEFAFRLDTEIHDRRRQKISDEIQIEEFKHEQSLDNAKISALRASSLRTKANSAALSGDLRGSRELHEQADQLEEATFANLESRSVNLGEIVNGANEGSEVLKGILTDLGFPEDQPINGSLTPEEAAQPVTTTDKVTPVRGEPTTPTEKLNVIRGGKPERKRLDNFRQIETQEDLNELVRLAGVDPTSKEGQATIERLLPKTALGDKIELERQQAKNQFLAQAINGNIGETEAAIGEFQELGGDRAQLSVAKRVGERHKAAFEGVQKAQEAMFKASSEVNTSFFRAGVEPEFNEDGTPKEIKASDIKTQEGRTAIAKSNVMAQVAARQLATATVEMQQAETDLIQFKIDTGLLPPDTIEKIREVQDQIEGIDQQEIARQEAESANPSPVTSGAVPRISGITDELLDEDAGDTTGLETRAQVEDLARQSAETSKLLNLPGDKFDFAIDDEAIDIIEEASLETMVEHRIQNIAPDVDTRTLEVHDEDIAFGKHNTRIEFVKKGFTDDQLRENTQSVRDYVTNNANAFNRLSKGEQRSLFARAYDMRYGEATSSYVPGDTRVPGFERDFWDSEDFPITAAAKSLGLDSSGSGSIDPQELFGDNLQVAAFAVAMAESQTLKDDAGRIDPKKVDFAAVAESIKARAAAEEEAEQPINGSEPPEPSGPPEPTAEDIASRIGVDPSVVRQLALPPSQPVEISTELGLGETEEADDKVVSAVKSTAKKDGDGQSSAAVKVAKKEVKATNPVVPKPINLPEDVVVSGRGNYGGSKAWKFSTTKKGIEKELVTVKADGGAKFRVHKSVAGNIAGFVKELESLGYKIDAKNSSGWNWRPQRRSKRLSQHSYGTAIDINWNENKAYWGGSDKISKIKGIDRIAAKYGLTWGGLWDNNDTMHFEFHPDNGVAAKSL